MFTDDNTEGFTKEQLDEMNAEVGELMSTLYTEDYDYQQYLQWVEEKVLKKYGGA